jgi:histidinol-phosphate aminotransferase
VTSYSEIRKQTVQAHLRRCDIRAMGNGETSVKNGKIRFRSVLEGGPGFQPVPRRVNPLDGRSYLLGSNESPESPLPSVLDAIAAAAAEVNRYPDNACLELIQRIAAKYGVPGDGVVVGSGSVGVIQMLLESISEPGGEVVYAWRSFEVYPSLVSLAGMASVRVPLVDYAHDLTTMATAITDRTRLIFICNPNNPSGTALGHADLEEFLAQVPRECLVVLDEAYREYVTDGRVPDGLSLLSRFPNLAVLRTFSKAYGLAGLRVGFMVAHPAVADYVRRTYLPFTVSRVAQAGAIASLEAANELLERVRTTVAERTRVRDEIRTLGWTVPPSQANFVWVAAGKETASLMAACAERGVNVRAFPDEGLRVSIGAPEDNDAFLAAAAEYNHQRAR